VGGGEGPSARCAGLRFRPVGAGGGLRWRVGWDTVVVAVVVAPAAMVVVVDMVVMMIVAMAIMMGMVMVLIIGMLVFPCVRWWHPDIPKRQNLT
jgi:hypothetical protein